MTTSDLFIGIGLRHPHQKQVLDEKPAVDWFEVHSENFFHQGGFSLHSLLSIRQHYPISLHGVGLSLGSVEGIKQYHLDRLKTLIDYVDPFLISEHLSWSGVGQTYLPDLLPIPYNKESFEIFCSNVSKTQDFLKREILIENPSSYFEYKISVQEEAAFLVELCQRTGAKILLDVNNIFVSCSNHNWDSAAYLEAIPNALIKEIHLAGHSIKQISEHNFLRIDTHDGTVCDEVWSLYKTAVQKFGKVPSLIEWDANIPPLTHLIAEAKKLLTVIPENAKHLSGIQDDVKATAGSRLAHFVLGRDDTAAIQHLVQQSLLSEPKQLKLDFVASSFAQERFAIYRQTLFENLRHALAITFPGIWILLGEECANSVAYAFIKQSSNLPTTGCLDDWGYELVNFFETITELKQLPYLKDVAIVEWYKHQSYIAADTSCVEITELQRFSESEINELQFQFHPSVFLFQSRYPLQHIFNVIEDLNAPTIDLNLKTTYALILRNEYDVEKIWLQQQQWLFLNALKQGKKLSEVFEDVLSIDQDFDLTQMIYFMFEKKLISAVKFDSVMPPPPTRG